MIKLRAVEKDGTGEAPVQQPPSPPLPPSSPPLPGATVFFHVKSENIKCLHVNNM